MIFYIKKMPVIPDIPWFLLCKYNLFFGILHVQAFSQLYLHVGSSKVSTLPFFSNISCILEEMLQLKSFRLE